MQYRKEDFKFYRPSEILPEFIGPTSGLNIRPQSVSSPRALMTASQLGQKPAIMNGEPARIFTGFEREHGKYLHQIKVKEDCYVISVFDKYPDLTPRNDNPPSTIVVVETLDGLHDVIEVPHNHCRHQSFGFKYVRTELMKNLSIGQALSAGDILAKPPTLNNDGDWCYGRNLRMGLIPSEEGIEDGLALSESTVKKFALHGYGTVEFSFGRNRVPLNLHGDDKVYKPWPDIGDVIPPDGIIAAIRKFDLELAPANMSIHSLSRVNQTDEIRAGIPGAKIVDIKVIKGNPQTNNLPKVMERQVDKYWGQTLDFYRVILDVHNQIKSKYRTNKYDMSPEWGNLVRDAMFYLDAKDGVKRETYRGKDLSDTLVVIQYEYICIPANGGKYTDRNAGKAVVTRVVPDDEMPLDEDGVPLDGYMDDISTSNRMNTPRMDEIVITACAETCVNQMRDLWYRGDKEGAWNLMREFYSIISPPMMLAMDEVTSPKQKDQTLYEVIRSKEETPPLEINGLRIFMASDLPIDNVEAIAELSRVFPPREHHLTITVKDEQKSKVVTKYPSVIGELYIMALERAGNVFTATASPKRQPHGIPVKPGSSERASSVSVDTPTRNLDEDTTRGMCSLIGAMGVAEIFDRSLNPISHQQECRSIFHSENPARIRTTVPRNEDELDETVYGQKIIPLSGGRVSQLRNHIMATGGFKFDLGEDGDAISDEELAQAMQDIRERHRGV